MAKAIALRLEFFYVFLQFDCKGTTKFADVQENNDFFRYFRDNGRSLGELWDGIPPIVYETLRYEAAGCFGEGG